MTGWRQAVFIRQRRIDVIQRALSKILDDESWSPATPRRLHVGTADASSRGWTMIVPELANFFLDRGGMLVPRLCRLARELRCPAYEIDVRHAAATTLFEVDPLGRMRISGSPIYLIAGLDGHAEPARAEGLGVATAVVGFGLLAIADDIRARIAGLHGGPPMALADYLGAIAGFPAWTHLGDEPIAAGELIYEPRISDRALGHALPRVAHESHAGGRGRSRIIALATAALTAQASETREAIGRSTPRAGSASLDRRGSRPRSAARPRR
jgi:hypothetical protein